MSDEQYKSLLIVNESKDASITLYLYSSLDFLYLISFSSKIILPGQKYLYRSKDSFKFKLVARFEDKPKQTLLKPRTWDADKLLKVTEDLRLTEGKLEDFPSEKRVCLRKLQRDKELNTTSGKRNLYAILGLDMDQIRHMPREEQKEAIKKGFREQIKRWHPDKNFGDEDNAKEIIMAHEVLLDDEMRARYHNEADYDKGWLSPSRWRAIFNPERFTVEQKKTYEKRMIMFALSLGITIGGIVLTAVTAGLAAPAVVTVGGVLGSAMIGAGLQSLQHTVNEKSVVTEECDTTKWLVKDGIGFVLGAVIGLAAVGITAGVAGLGKSAMESTAVKMGQYIKIGAGTGAAGGAVSSVASDAGRKFVDGEEVTLKQAVCHVALSAFIGAVAGTAGGAITKAFVSGETSATTANIKVEVGEQIAILTGARRLVKVLAKNIPRALTKSGTEAVMQTAGQFVVERLDDSVENQSLGQHLVKGARKTPKVGVRESVTGLLSEAKNKIKVSKRVKKYSNDDKSGRLGNKRVERLKISLENNEHLVKYEESSCSATYQPLVPSEQMDPLSANEYVNPVVDIDGEVGLNDSRGQVKHERFEENKEHLIKLGESACSPTNQPLESDQLLENETSPLPVVSEEACVLEEHESDQLEDMEIKYISEGAWTSRMIVSFFLDGKETTKIVSGSGKFVTIPSRARDIEVKFQVRRPFWGDVMKYNRFREAWFRPYEPHVFRYDKPTNRTFTISGNLWWEAVMGVTNEYHDETKEL